MRLINLPLIGLIVGVAVLGCSEKVEHDEKEVVEHEQATDVDSYEEIISEKLNQIIIPRLDFDDFSLDEAIGILAIRSHELDISEPAEMRGIGFVVRYEPNALSPRISELRLRNVSLAAALRYICLMTGMRCELNIGVTLVPRDPNAPWNAFGEVLEEKGDTAVVLTKLKQIHLPVVSFANMTIYEVIDMLRVRSVEMDIVESDPKRKGINFVVYVPEGMEVPIVDEIGLRDASIEEVLKEICGKTGMRYELDTYSVILVPKDLK